MGEQHLDLLPLPARDDVGLGLGDGTSLVAGGFIDRAWYLASRSIRAAARLQRAGVAVRLAGAVAHGVVLRRCGPWRGERSSVFLQLLAARADVDVARMYVFQYVDRTRLGIYGMFMRPFTAVTRVRIPLGTPALNIRSFP